MKFNKLPKTIAAVATATMMAGSPLMAMAADPSVDKTPILDDLVADGSVTVTYKDGAIDSLTVVGSDSNDYFPVKIKDAEGKVTTVFFVLKDGSWDKTASSYTADGQKDRGPIQVGSGKFFVEEGLINTSANGMVATPDGVFFCAAGQILEDYSGLAQFAGKTFVVKNGVVDTTFNGLYPFETTEGKGVAFVAAGMVQSQFSGITDDGEKMYIITEGLVQTWTTDNIAGYEDPTTGTVYNDTLVIKEGVITGVMDGETFVPITLKK